MRCPAAMPCITLLICWTTSLPLLAQPEAYARHWPVQAEDVGIYAVNLTPALYAQIEHPNLRDLAAFNESGESLGFEPLASVWAQPEPQWNAAQWFALPTPKSGQAEELSIQLERRSDGSVRLRGDVGTPSQAASSGDLLVDTGMDADADLRLLALTFELDPRVVDFSTRIRIEGSHDLESWRTLVASAGLLRLQQDGQLLERRRIELPGSEERYLRLRLLDNGRPLPLKGLEVQTQAAAVLERQPIEHLTAELVSRDGRTFIYRLAARIPVEQVHLRLAQDNTVASASLAGRESEEDPWHSKGNLTAFRLRAEGVELDNEPLQVSGSRYRQWRVTVGNDLAEAPTLEFSYRPERWLLLTQGNAPYVIAAGSSQAVRDTVPLSALLAPIRAKYGADWQPPEAALGEPIVVAGDAATEAPKASAAERWSGFALWLVLIGSALAIGVMVLRLMGERPHDSEN